jgi:hypothetical protein
VRQGGDGGAGVGAQQRDELLVERVHGREGPSWRIVETAAEAANMSNY